MVIMYVRELGARRASGRLNIGRSKDGRDLMLSRSGRSCFRWVKMQQGSVT